MVTQQYPLDWWQWNIRPRDTRWPEWFKAWPGGARVAVEMDLMHECGLPPPTYHITPGRPQSVGRRYEEDYMALTAQEYAFKAGVWRLMDMLDRQRIKATVKTSGLSAELWPETCRELKLRGHEIACHQFNQSLHPTVTTSREEEQALLRRAIAAIEKATGVRPKGYMSPGPRPTPHTLELVVEEGFVWDGDYYDSDLPYILNVKGKKLVNLPYCRPGYIDTEVVNYFSNNIQSPDHALAMLKWEFDAVYEESERHPMRFCFSLHTFSSGRPGTTKLFEEFIKHMKRHSGVWFATGIEQANFWLEHEASGQ